MVWIVLENVGYGVVGSPAAPYLNHLISQCGLATNYHGTTHPSLPNYIALTSGSTQGISNDNDPASNRLAAPSIFSQLRGRWRSYVESMPTPCDKVSAGEYAAKHNPAAYFTDLGASCARNDIPLPAHPSFAQPFTIVIPDLCHDMHSCSVAVGDTWLRSFIPRVLLSPQYRSGDLVLAITFDENTTDSSNRVPTIVVAPSVPQGLKVGAYLDHYSLLRTTEQLLRLAPLARASSARTMVGLFHL
ncbi:MAG: alkaline phosphatase family protein [Solirubrobacteraceae bacterium]